MSLPDYDKAREAAQAYLDPGLIVTDDVIINPGQEIWMFQYVDENAVPLDGGLVVVGEDLEPRSIAGTPDDIEFIGAEWHDPALDGEAKALVDHLIETGMVG